jgi:hypothetical protein
MRCLLRAVDGGDGDLDDGDGGGVLGGGDDSDGEVTVFYRERNTSSPRPSAIKLVFFAEAIFMMESTQTALDLPFRAAGSHPWHVDAVKGSPLTAHTLTRQCGWAGAGFGLLRRALLRALAHVRLRPLPRGNNACEHMRAEARAHSFHRPNQPAHPLPVPPRKPLCLDRIDCRAGGLSACVCSPSARPRRNL